MKRKHLFLVPLLGLFLSLSLVSCEKEPEKFGARPVDESELNHIPIGFLRFKWQGVPGNQQTLTMWKKDFVETEEQVAEAPYFYRIGFGRNYATLNDDFFVFQTDQWIPLLGEEYEWNITSYHQNGDVVVSDSRSFFPNPVQ